MKRLTDDECDTFRRMPLSFNDMIRAAYDAGWQWQLREPINKELVEALEKYRQAMDFTRQYVGYDTLPAIEGWSWYDADIVAQAALAKAKEKP